MDYERCSGVFLHLTSLPGPHGIGDLGDGARQFLDFLERADQTLWQFCPLGPTTGAHAHSPYASPSAFAGNPLLVDLEAVADRGYLDDSALDGPDGADPTAVEYETVAGFKRDRLWDAYESFAERPSEDERDEFATFRERQSSWLDDYALFAALKTAHDGAAWPDWPADLVKRAPDALAEARERHAERIEYHEFVQWTFDRQWRALRAEAADRGISLIGDLPIYVAHDSADVWANQDTFRLHDDGRPTAVAGVPPNAGDTGQRWGNPVYDWDRLRAADYDWWVDRLERLLDQVDIARIDHFKAFDEFWAIPGDADDPAAGEWRSGPGADFFETVRAELGELPFVVEDLGFIDESMVALRDRFGFPGMRVPQYADWCSEADRYKPVTYPRQSVAYTSTHDTDTAVGFYESLPQDQRDCLHYALATDGERIAWDVVEAVWDSDAVYAMTTMPDLLELGSEARFNTPGTTDGNWRWRVQASQLDPDVADELATITAATLR